MEQNQPAQQMQIKIREDDLKGAYSNMMQVISTREEFIMDFFFNAPPQAILASRIIISPAHAKRVAAVLTENVKKYEERFGKIENLELPEEKIGFVK